MFQGSPKFQGSIVALVTPMSAAGAVDYQALESLVEYHVDCETEAIVSVGTTGESATLTMDEHIEVIRRTVDLSRGRVPVIGGTGANSTTEAIELTEQAARAGVDACLLVTPYYNRPTQEGLFLHHKAVADAVSIPQILYNVPGRTACDLLPETVVRLAEVGNIIGLKDASGDPQRGAELLRMVPGEFELFSGEDAIALELIAKGFRGVISVTANVAAAAMHDMCAAARQGNMELAEAINQRLMPLHQGLFVEANPIPVKWCLQEMGMIGPGIRLPLTPLSARYHQLLRDALKHAAVLGN